jgi:hypothetical protein
MKIPPLLFAALVLVPGVAAAADDLRAAQPGSTRTAGRPPALVTGCVFTAEAGRGVLDL